MAILGFAVVSRPYKLVFVYCPCRRELVTLLGRWSSAPQMCPKSLSLLVMAQSACRVLRASKVRYCLEPQTVAMTTMIFGEDSVCVNCSAVLGNIFRLFISILYLCCLVFHIAIRTALKLFSIDGMLICLRLLDILVSHKASFFHFFKTIHSTVIYY